jgi:hypothetical protein
MSAHTTPAGGWVELADRSGDGLDVRLLWNRSTGRVKVTRVASGRTAELRVAPEDALTAFHHPFAYREPAPEGKREPVTAID